MNIERFFSDSDLAAIREATRRAEERTAGEIVPYIIAQCGAYSVANWRGATAGAAIGMILLGLLHALWPGWWRPDLFWATAAASALASTVLGLVLPSLSDRLRHLLLCAREEQEAVQLRANSAFLEQEVFNTRDRTGVLLFVALFERKVLLVADSGIHARIPPDQWQGIIDRLVEGIRRGAPAQAIIEAIGECGVLLLAHRVEIRPDDTDELSNEPRIQQR